MPRATPPAAGTFLPAAAFLLTVSISPMLEAPAWTPRAALLLLIGAAGVPVLVWLAWRRYLPAILALAWVGWAVVSTSLSEDPMTSLLGLYNWGTGLLFVVAAGSCFALAARSSDCTRKRLAVALIAGAGINAFVAAGQATQLLTTPPFESQFGAATGALGNSAHLGGLMSAALLAVVVGAIRPSVPLLGLGSGLALALFASASRTGLLLAVGAALALATRRRWAACGTLILCLVLGGVAAEAVTQRDRVTGTRRLTTQTAGFAPRIAAWETGITAIRERPILGAGPGRFRAATLPVRTRQQAAAQGQEVFVDAHSLVVEYAVTTGLVGTALLLGFLATALGCARGPWAWFALAMLAMHLVQPQSVVTTPLLFLALGLASRPPDDPAPVVALAVARSGLGTGAAVTAALLLLGDHALYQGRFNLAVNTALRAEQLLPAWPKPAAIAARAYAFQYESGHRQEDAQAAERWFTEAAERAPDDPSGWITLARIQRYLGEEQASEHSLRRALAADGFSVEALNEAGTLLASEGRYGEALDLLHQSLAVAPAQPPIQQLVRRIFCQTTGC